MTDLIATAFDHFDSRAGDPHLHTHVVISNKVQTVLDGKWRSLDGRPIHAAVVALSELHESLRLRDSSVRSLDANYVGSSVILPVYPIGSPATLGVVDNIPCVPSRSDRAPLA